MRFLWIFLVSAFVCVGSGQAQPLTLRSGDHPSFSRITVPLLESQTWEAKRTLKGVEIELPGFSQGFDTSAVFTRMGFEHIIAVDAQSNKFFLNFDCLCIASVFRSGPLLVIDVAREGIDLAGSLIEESILLLDIQTENSHKITENTSVLPWVGRVAASSISRSVDNNSEKLIESNLYENQPYESDKILQQVQKKVVERVANATSIGLLESSHEGPLEALKITDKSGNNQDSQLRIPPKSIITPSQNIQISSSIDFPLNQPDSNLNMISNGVICPEGSYLSVEGWGDNRSFSAQIGPARNALMDTRDRLNKIAAKELAKLFIYFGFGAEATNTLKLDTKLASENSELSDIAMILERGAIPRPNSLSAFADCNSNIALWATLSFEHIPAGTLIDTAAVLRALNKLPKHLRQVIAPSLSDRLLQFGDSSTATAAMRSIERLSEPLTMEILMSQAALAIEAGKSAEATLEMVIEANSSEAPEALVKLVEGKLARNEILDLETTTLIEAYGQELRGTTMGNKLHSTQVIALSQAKRFEQAFDTLENLAPGLSPEAHADLQEIIVEQLAKNADDLTFLEHFFAKGLSDIDELRTNTKLALAKRMIGLGFSRQAEEVLLSISQSPSLAERQILIAQSALSLRKPFKAQAVLSNIEGPEVTMLLAKAKEQAGEYREAAELFASRNAGTQSTQAAWLADGWQTLTQEIAPALNAVATLAQNDLAEQGADLGLLGRANLALDESSSARDTLEKLLRDPLVQLSPES